VNRNVESEGQTLQYKNALSVPSHYNACIISTIEAIAMKKIFCPLLSFGCHVFVLIGFALLSTGIQAGTVISTNLPSGVSIVNIDARADGAATFSGDSFQSFWFRPTASAPSLTLQPGTYQFRIINPADTALLYPTLTSAQLNQIYTGWTFNSPWSENYFVFKSTAVTNTMEFQLFDGALAPGLVTFPSAAAAYSATVANGYYNKIRPAPPGRAGIAADFLSQYTFTSVTSVLFVIPDTILSDNSGGVSVVVSPVTASPLTNKVPFPVAFYWLMGGCLAVLISVSRFRKLN
jgi:hypothetical protein